MFTCTGVWSNIFSLNVIDVWNAYNNWKWPFPDKENNGGKRALCNFLDFNGNY